jgi:hypothetical protein
MKKYDVRFWAGFIQLIIGTGGAAIVFPYKTRNFLIK